jgi:hypothetical protein
MLAQTIRIVVPSGNENSDAVADVVPRRVFFLLLPRKVLTDTFDIRSTPYVP